MDRGTGSAAVRGVAKSWARTWPVPLTEVYSLHLAGLGGEGHIDIRHPRFVFVFDKDSSTRKVSFALSFLLFFFWVL